MEPSNQITVLACFSSQKFSCLTNSYQCLTNIRLTDINQYLTDPNKLHLFDISKHQFESLRVI